MSCRTGLRSRPFDRRRRPAGRTGLDVARMNSRKAAPIQPCTASTLARSVAGRLPPKSGDQRAEEGEDQHPEQHRALVVAPGAGDLVEHRLQRMGVLPDIGDREIRLRVGRVSAAKASAVSAKPVTATGPPTAIMRPLPVRAPTSGTTDWTSASAKARTSAKWPVSTIARCSVHRTHSARLSAATRPSPSGCRRLPSACSSRHAWPARCRRRKRRPVPKLPSVMTPCSSRNRSGRMPV